MPLLKLLLKLLGAVLVLLVAAIVVNTLRLPPLPAADGTKMAPLADPDKAAERLAEAIRIPTISWGFAEPPGGNRFPELHALLARNYPQTHKELKREVIGMHSLLYTWQGTDAALPPILLTAHQDVVPIEPGTEKGWTHPPFGGVIADGFVWGRGTLDNKQMLVATLESVENLLAAGFRPRRTLLLAFGHDEEIGGPLGAKLIADELERRKVRAYFSLDEGSALLDGVVPDASRIIAQIGIAEKGFLTVQLKATAVGGHSSMPPPSTAVGKLGRAIARLETHQMPASLDGPGMDGLRAMAPALPLSRRVALANTWLFGKLLERELSKVANTNALIRTTTAPTVFNAGIKENVLPSEATALVNFRLAPGDTVAQVKSHIERTMGDPDVAILPYRHEGAEATPVASTGSDGYRLLVKAIHQIEPSALVVPGLVVGGTDSKHYSRVSDAAFRFVPMRVVASDLKRIHATDERIGIANFGEIISFYMALIKAGAQ